MFRDPFAPRGEVRGFQTAPARMGEHPRDDEYVKWLVLKTRNPPPVSHPPFLAFPISGAGGVAPSIGICAFKKSPEGAVAKKQAELPHSEWNHFSPKRRFTQDTNRDWPTWMKNSGRRFQLSVTAVRRESANARRERPERISVVAACKSFEPHSFSIASAAVQSASRNNPQNSIFATATASATKPKSASNPRRGAPSRTRRLRFPSKLQGIRVICLYFPPPGNGMTSRFFWGKINPITPSSAPFRRRHPACGGRIPIHCHTTPEFWRIALFRRPKFAFASRPQWRIRGVR